jgi:hypothetical protein
VDAEGVFRTFSQLQLYATYVLNGRSDRPTARSVRHARRSAVRAAAALLGLIFGVEKQVAWWKRIPHWGCRSRAWLPFI